MRLSLHPPLIADAAIAGEPFVVSLPLAVEAPLAFAPDLQLVLEEAASDAVAWIGRLGEEVRLPWLPRGTWFVRWLTPSLALAAGRYRIRAVAVDAGGARSETAAEFDVGGGIEAGALSGAWQLEAAGDAPPLESLAWRHPGEGFSMRFDTLAERILGELLADASELRGRVLEIGCGDGVLALSLALRCAPQRLLALDAGRGYEALPALLAAQGLPPDCVPESLEFAPLAGTALPAPDAAFDLVLCLDGLPALAAGGDALLAEAVRVLAPGGLLCLHTRAATAPIGPLERHLRGLGLTPVRAALQCRNVVTYGPGQQDIPIPDLALGEICTVWRKPA
jgi:SAM-dependent methyltransferase